MARATDALGKIDILVNDAGISYDAVPLQKQPDDKIAGDLKAGLTREQ